MEAKKYLQNQFILENCKEYLEILKFLPKQEEIWELVKSYDPQYVKTSQSFKKVNNKDKIFFKIHSFRTKEEADYFQGNFIGQIPVSSFILEVELNNNQLSSILVDINPYPFLKRKVYFMNNQISKVEDYFIEKIYRKKRISYYIKEKLVISDIYNLSLDKGKLESQMFVEDSREQGGYKYIEKCNERNFINGECINEKWNEESKIISHNQFNKRYGAVLKKVRKLGQ